MTLDHDELQQIFSHDLRERVIDKCPTASSDIEPKFWRHAEIMAWIRTTVYTDDWLALDDTEWEFPPDFPKLVLCDRSVGID